jgi:hypothetical protein
MAEENGQVVYYSYYVREHQNASYRTEYENNDTEHGIGSGTITIINQQVNTYQLPSAGGLGPWPYWGGGLALMGGAIYCFVLQGRREAPSPDARSEIARPYSKKRKRKQWNT